MREHNRKHGVTNAADYSPAYLAERKHRRESEGQRELKASRLADINHALHIHGR